jgi:hypothetical protein
MHTHRDMGFGATGNAFKAAADYLDGSAEFMRDNLFGARLPTNYLYRHAIELHLKSAIVIFHRRFTLPYGEFAFDSEPRVRVGETWKPFREVHSVKTLWTYVRDLFATHAAWLAEHTRCDWTIDAEVDVWVEAVHNADPRSTFFRYPTINRPESDASKSPMKAVTEDGLVQMLRDSNASDKRVFAMVVQNDDREFVAGYVHDDAAEATFNDALRKFSEYCHNLHAAMRCELCDGW